MLILTRKSRQRIFIGKTIILEVREIRPGSVSIGIEAPPEVKIVREELVKPLPEDPAPRAITHEDALLDPRN